MTALFVAVFVEQWKGTRRRRPALVGVAVSVLALLAFGPDNFLIPATLGICAVLIGGRRFFETKKETETTAAQEVASSEEALASTDAASEKEVER